MGKNDTYIPGTIKVLGRTSDGEIILWGTDQRRLHRLRGFNELDEATIIHIGGDEAYDAAIERIQEDFEKPNPIRIIRNAIAHESRSRVFAVKEQIGQGVWRPPGKTWKGSTEPGVLIVNGNRAYRYLAGAENPWSIIPSPVMGTRLLDLGSEPWVDDTQLRPLIDSVTPEMAKASWDKLIDRLGAWKFRNETDRMIVAGLIIATSIQGFLDFRPQVWVCGPTNSGKTALKSLMAGLWPHAVECENETSEAGVRQTIEHHSMPLLMDEQEAWHGRPKLIKAMRSATRGGVIRKGTTSGKAMEFRMSCISWWFSIEYELPRAADRNRFAIIELERQERFVMPPMGDLDLMGLGLLACAIREAEEISATWKQLSTDPVFARFGRLSEVFALPLAVHRIMVGEDNRELFESVMNTQAAELATETVSDEQDLLQTILMAIPPGGGPPLAYYLEKIHIRQIQPLLEGVGIRQLPGDDKRVFIATEILKKELLVGTKWAGANVKQMLRRLNGATEDKQRINGMNLNGVSMPMIAILPRDSRMTPSKGFSMEGPAQACLPEPKPEPEPKPAPVEAPDAPEMYAGMSEEETLSALLAEFEQDVGPMAHDLGDEAARVRKADSLGTTFPPST